MEFIKRTELKTKNEYLSNIKNPKNTHCRMRYGTTLHTYLLQDSKTAKVTAIDLSSKSIAYAKRKTEELGIKNIEYYQPDILDLKRCIFRF